jgi:hypothetical protein
MQRDICGEAEMRLTSALCNAGALVQQLPRRAIGHFLLTLIVGPILLVSVALVINSSTKEHWSLGIIMTLLYAFSVFLGVMDLRNRSSQSYYLHKGLFISLLIAWSGIAVAASASLQLQNAGWAVYDPPEPLSPEYDYYNFLNYYTWVFLDMLPGLDAVKLLHFERPLQSKNWIGGVPVILFRAFVVLALFAALKLWWQGKKQAGRIPPEQPSD